VASTAPSQLMSPTAHLGCRAQAARTWLTMLSAMSIDGLVELKVSPPVAAASCSASASTAALAPEPMIGETKTTLAFTTLIAWVIES